MVRGQRKTTKVSQHKNGMVQVAVEEGNVVVVAENAEVNDR